MCDREGGQADFTQLTGFNCCLMVFLLCVFSRCSLMAVPNVLIH